MPSPEIAAKLLELIGKPGTGNVDDLVRESVVKIPPLKRLSDGGGYQAAQHHRNVIIVESDYDPAVHKGDEAKDEAALDAICEEAISLGDRIAAGT